jgi:hypothetical protein
MVIIIVVLIVLASCAERRLVTQNKPVKRGKVGEEFVIQQSENRVPKWAVGPDFQVVKEKREKFIVVTCDISHKERRAAERIAEGELRKRVAEGTKTLVDSQFREALTGTSDTFSQTFASYVETVANNVPVVGMMVTDTYWEKIQRVKGKKDFEYYYRVVKRAKMPYNNYADARDKAWQDVLTKTQTEEERRELEKLIKNMKSADEI